MSVSTAALGRITDQMSPARKAPSSRSLIRRLPYRPRCDCSFDVGLDDAGAVGIRAVTLVGQIALVRRARPLILRAVGWSDFEGERLQTLKEVLWQGITSSLG
jgi:HTH-type transcriptional dual regulator CecR, C-terminal domain